MKEEIKQKISVIISATNTSGNEKRDAILLLFNDYISKDKVMEIAAKVWIASIRKQTDQNGEPGYTEVMNVLKKEYGL